TYDRAAANFAKAIDLDPEEAGPYVGRAMAHQHKKEFAQAVKDFDAALRREPQDARICNNLAWLLATCPDAAVRDGNQAVLQATKACELTKWKDARSVGTLAAACAEAGQFDEAVTWQKKALELGSKDPEAEAAVRKRLQLYEERKPYR